MNLNGAKVTKRGETLFMPLPSDLRRTIPGGCQCPYCTNHPDETPQWDTLAIAADASSSFAWTVHYPELKS